MNLNFSLNLDFLSVQFCTIFCLIFTISYIHRILVFLEIWTFCTYNVHNFPLNIHYILHFTNSIFSLNLEFLYILCTQFFIEFSRYHTFNEFEFFHVFGPFELLMYTIFHWIFLISFILQIWIVPRIRTFCTFNEHNFS